MTHQTVDRFKDIAIVAWAIIGVFLIVYGLARVLGEIGLVLRPFVFAFIIVFVLKPVLAFLEQRGIPRLAALIITYVFFFALLAVVLVFLVPVIIDEVSLFIKNFPAYVRMTERGIRSFQLGYRAVRIPAEAGRIVQSALNSLRDSTISLLSGIPGFTVTVLSLLLDFILAPLIAFFILLDRDRLAQAVLGLIPAAYKDEGLYLARRLNTAIEGYLRIMLIEAIVVGIFSSVGLVAMGIPYALLLGFFAGFIQIVPYIGPVIGTVPAVMVALFTRGGWYALAVAVYFTVVTQLGSLVLTPIMMRQHVGVHPVLVIFALLLGGALFGFWGIVLAIPVAAVVNEIASFFLLSPVERAKRMQVL